MPTEELKADNAALLVSPRGKNLELSLTLRWLSRGLIAQGLTVLEILLSLNLQQWLIKLRHKNLVQLQGWCCEGSEVVLVYDHLQSSSLDKVLHKNTSSAIILSWKQRLNIVLGVAFSYLL